MINNNNKPPDAAILNNVTEEFIHKSIRNDFIPRLAIDTIESAETERKQQKNYSSYYYSNESPEPYDANSAKELLNSAQLKLSDLKKNNEELDLKFSLMIHLNCIIYFLVLDYLVRIFYMI
jgi:hypothetical protein